MKRNRSPFLVAGVCAVAILVLLAEIAVRRADALPDDTYKELATFANVLAIVQKNYVEPVTTKQLINGAITGMLASLDPHSAYLHARPLSRSRSRNPRQLWRAGSSRLRSRTTCSPSFHRLRTLPPTRPASRRATRSSRSTTTSPRDDADRRGQADARPQGSQIHLTIHRKGVPELFTVSVTREVIKIKSVKAKELPHGYDYIRVSQFRRGHRRRSAKSAGQIPCAA